MSNEVLSRIAPDARVASARARPAAAVVMTADGKTLPLNGDKEPPRAESAKIELPEEPDLSRMVEKLNDFLRQSARSLQFRYDEVSGRTVITVVDAASGDVIRQIPSDELLAMAERMRAAGQTGALIDLRV